MPVRLLIVGAGAGAFAQAAEIARGLGADVAIAPSRDDAFDHLRANGAALVMIDVAQDVPAFIRQASAERFITPILACGVDAPTDRAVAAIRAGARDYIPLPPDRDLIAAAIHDLAGRETAPLIGEDPAFARAVAFARAMAGATAPVLIVGERGTGKGRLAEEIHAASARSGYAMVECAGMDESVLASELFGHAPDALASGSPGRRGAITIARGGTLFVRDIDRLPPALQTLLIASLDAGGAPRLIASTTRQLAMLVEAGTFRGDLAARFALAQVTLPPLRDRGEDWALLARLFLRRFAAIDRRAEPTLSQPARALLAAHDWPGNVAELAETMHRAVLLAHDGLIGPDAIVLANGTHLAATPGAGSRADIEPLVGRTVEEVERALILETLERCHGNRTFASQVLGISVRTMRNKLKAFVEAGIPVAPAA